MTLAEAILTAEGYFQVHREIGYAEPFYKGDDPVEGAEKAAAEYLRTLTDKALIHKIVLGLGYTIAQRT